MTKNVTAKCGPLRRSSFLVIGYSSFVIASSFSKETAMSEQTQQLRSVAWSEVFPWLMLVRALRLATSAPLLLVATVAVLLMPLGWHAAALLLGEPAAQSVAQRPVNDVR